jgi:diguanylate cyclase (GGDEF)-like protein
MIKVREFDGTQSAWLQLLCTLVLLSLCVVATASESDSHPMRFDQLTLDDGLSQSTVISILQDSKGLMWFGTENGLNSYNGYEFEHFKRERGNPEALANDFIFDLAEDRDGNIWLATNGGGLAKMERGTRRFESFRHDPESSNSISSNVIRTLLIDTDGIIWLGTRGAGLDRFDPKSKTFTHYRFRKDDLESLDADDIYTLHKDSSGILWAGSNEGLYRLDTASEEIKTYRHVPERTTSISDHRIRSILEDSTGQLWVGTYGGGLNRFDPKTEHFESFRNDADDASTISSDRVAAIFEDADNRFWMGTSAGLNLMDRERGTFTRYTHDNQDSSSLGADSITALFQDRGGILWVGTKTRGLSKWNPRTWALGLENAQQLTASGESQPNVTSFAEGEAGTLWIGSFGDGVNAVNRDDGVVTHYRHDPADSNSISGDRVMSLMRDAEGMLWIGTMMGGVNRLDPETGKNQVYKNDPSDPHSLSANGVMALFQDSRSLVWVGTFGGGISRFDPQTNLFTRFQIDPTNPNSLSSNRVTSFAEDPSGKIWVGTDAGGLNLFDPETEKFHHFRHNTDDPSSIADDTVYSINVAEDGTVWVGTRGGGLDRVVGATGAPADIVFTNLAQRDGLANDVIYGIEFDNAGQLWMSTNYGISRLNPKTRTIKNMHRNDGLQSEEFNFGAHYRSDSGELFFGGHNGFNAFQPDNVQANAGIPLIALTGFFNSKDPLKSDLPIDENEGVEISYTEDTVSFEFAAMDFADPGKNQYMYKLEGFDKDWVELGNRRRVTYTDLNDGQYLLRVKAANADGVWNDAGFSMPVRVTPAPWDTWWAYLGYVAMFAQLVVLLWLGHKRKIQREEEYSNRLETEVHQRTAELAERNQELKELNCSLQESSLSDPLTGLRNRRFVFDEVSRDLEVIRRKYDDEEQGIDPKDAADLVFMMIDLDNFKPINDTYGHAAGDQMLLEVRDVLLSTCRRSDHVIRWGGDEFVVIAKQANPGESEALAERIRSRIADHKFTLNEGQVVRTTCSIGFAAFPIFRAQADDASLDKVINMADNLMYEAKRERNAWAGMLGISEAATSANFDVDSIEPTSILFRARHQGNLTQMGSDENGDRVTKHLSVAS